VDKTTNDKLRNDGIDRRGFLQCMAWVGTAVVWKLGSGGVLTSQALGADSAEQHAGGGGGGGGAGDFCFAQVSDSHIGFSKEPNRDVAATLQIAVDRMKRLKVPPQLLLHTGDLTHLSKPAEFDTVDQILRGATAGQTFYVPGEHDVFTDDGRAYLDRYGKGAKGGGWYSFDHHGIHFVGLVNVMNLKAGGLGVLGREQLEWLEADLKGRGSSTPIVVFAHVPLWAVYPKWGWGTEDAAQALSYLRRFASVSVLNGHIHQVLQKVEGNITFHTARSTAFPQPEPGKADSPGPMKNVPAEKLKRMLGLTTVNYTEHADALAVVDSTLE
jgi:3',5'-cyclic AMP phosphodiesterase CpdA